MSIVPESPEIDRLIEQAVAGNRPALEALLMHFHDPLLRYLERKRPAGVSASVSTEDVVQEALIEACRVIRTIEPRGRDAFFAWLKTIGRTRLINQINAARALKRGGARKQVRNTDPADSAATSILHLIASEDPTASRIAQRREALVAMKQALAELPQEKRDILEMRHIQGLSIQDIVELTGKSESAVKMIVSRTLVELKAAISGLGEFTAGV